jgi:hypothetical protein
MTTYREADIREQGLYDKLVFIVGNARSGTTILANILNMSERVFLMEEANLFVELGKADFPKRFNAQHAENHVPPRKGTYVPPFEGEEETGLTTLRRLALDYDFVGDKVAFSPHDPFDGKTAQTFFFEQYTKYFRGCHYILTSRNPHESLLSMHRLFPSEKLDELLLCWLESLRCACICVTWFPRCRMVFSEDLGPETCSAIGEFLGLQLTVPEAYFDERLRRTSLPAAYAFAREHDAQLGPLFAACDIIYRDLHKMFSPTTLRYTAREQIFGLIGIIIDRIEETQRKYWPPSRPEIPVPAAENA